MISSADYLQIVRDILSLPSLNFSSKVIQGGKEFGMTENGRVFTVCKLVSILYDAFRFELFICVDADRRFALHKYVVFSGNMKVDSVGYPRQFNDYGLFVDYARRILPSDVLERIRSTLSPKPSTRKVVTPVLEDKEGESPVSDS